MITRRRVRRWCARRPTRRSGPHWAPPSGRWPNSRPSGCSGRLRALRLGEIREVRGCGAMVAVETSLNAPVLLRRLEQRGILALAGRGRQRSHPRSAHPRTAGGRRRCRGAGGDHPGEPSPAATAQHQRATPTRSRWCSRADPYGAGRESPCRPVGRQLRRSTIIAIPWPPPTHMVSRPMVASAV